jgi:hypothetical protein
VTNSQLFTFAGGAGPLALEPENAVGTCLTVTSANILDQAPCNKADANQAFTFSGGGAASVAATTTALAASSTSSDAIAASSTSSDVALVAATSSPAASSAPAVAQCNSITTVFVTRAAASSAAAVSTAPASSSVAAAASSVASAVQSSAPDTTGTSGEIILATNAANPTDPVPVSGAGGTLQPSSAAEAQKRDNTATRAFSSVSLKASNGQCLFIDPTAGDFRQNLIPVNLQPCQGSLNEKFDLITAGIHNNTPNTTLVVSSMVSFFFTPEVVRTNLR